EGAGAGARAGRDDGGDVRDRQCVQDQRVAVRAGQLDRLRARQRIQRSGRPCAQRGAHHARPRPVRADLHRPRLLAVPARAARPRRREEDMSALYRRRLFVNRFNLVMSLCTMAIGMIFLFWILAVLTIKGFAALSPTLVTQMTPPPGSSGGLANAIFGSVVIVGVATF